MIQSGLLYRKDYDLGDKCDVVCHRLGKSFAARITGVNEVFKAGQHSVSLTFGESASTVYQRVARHGRGDVRGYELPQITSRRGAHPPARERLADGDDQQPKDGGIARAAAHRRHRVPEGRFAAIGDRGAMDCPHPCDRFFNHSPQMEVH